jgi:hypothetical protein
MKTIFAPDFPPEGITVREPLFGTSPGSPLFPFHMDDSTPHQTFKICWENQFSEKDGGRKLSVVVHERDDGHLIAEVFCTDPGLVNVGVASVGLSGTIEEQRIHKSIPFRVLEKDGCSGSFDFGLFKNVVKELGQGMRVVTFLGV